MNPSIVQAATKMTLLGNGSVESRILKKALKIAPLLVAVDGGVNAAIDQGITPDWVIGDMDSATPGALDRMPPGRVITVREQETTDFEKALIRFQADLIFAVGFTGARMDHQLAVLSTLVKYPGQRVLLLSDEEVTFLAPLRIELDLPPATRLSLFPMGPCTGRSTGLKWPIDGIAFAPGGQIGTSNETTKGRVALEFDNRHMLVILENRHLDEVARALTLSSSEH